MGKDLSKISRNNKVRGRNFENKVASTLGWTRVPYSGAHKAFGGGDVVDGYKSGKGIWAVECKTQQPGPVRSVSIQDKWITQMDRGTAGTDRFGIIATRLAESTGKSEAFVFLPPEAYLFLEKYLGAPTGPLRLKPAGKGRGFVVKREWLNTVLDNRAVLEIAVGSDPFNPEWYWYMVSLDTFAAIVKENNLHHPDE